MEAYEDMESIDDIEVVSESETESQISNVDGDDGDAVVASEMDGSTHNIYMTPGGALNAQDEEGHHERGSHSVEEDDEEHERPSKRGSQQHSQGSGRRKKRRSDQRQSLQFSESDLDFSGEDDDAKWLKETSAVVQI